MLGKILGTQFVPSFEHFQKMFSEGYRWFAVSTNEDGVRGWAFYKMYGDLPHTRHTDIQAHYIGNRTKHVGSCPACGNDFCSLLDCQDNEGEKFCTCLLCGQSWEVV